MSDNTFKDCAFFNYYLGLESYVPFISQTFFIEFKDCSDNFKSLKFQKTFKESLTTQYSISFEITTWIPQNSIISCSLNGTVLEKELYVELYSSSETPHYRVNTIIIIIVQEPQMELRYILHKAHIISLKRLECIILMVHYHLNTLVVLST